MIEKLSLEEKAAKILEDAESLGISTNFYFTSTFQRYVVQLQILNDLENAIKEYGATVTKEYVKGRQNLVANPAITEYNRTTTAANGTVKTLMNILTVLASKETGTSKLTSLIADLDDE